MKENSHIDKNTFDYLKPHKPKVGHFFLLPKAHKVNNPGRPIVSANGHPTEKISVDLQKMLSIKCKVVILQYQCEQLDKTFRWWFFNGSLVPGLSTCFDTVITQELKNYERK
jgi:hypothetical protein